MYLGVRARTHPRFLQDDRPQCNWAQNLPQNQKNRHGRCQNCVRKIFSIPRRDPSLRIDPPPQCHLFKVMDNRT